MTIEFWLIELFLGRLKKESLENNNDSIGLVKTFKIDVLTGLKTIKISNNIINHIKNSARNDRS